MILDENDFLTDRLDHARSMVYPLTYQGEGGGGGQRFLFDNSRTCKTFSKSF